MRHRLLLQTVLVVLGCWMLPPVASAASGCSNGSESQSLYAYGGRATLLSDTSIPVCTGGGRIEVSFTGGPGAARYAGTESWQPPGEGNLDVLTYRANGRVVREASLILGGFGNPVQSAVERSVATGSTACSDSSDELNPGFFTPRVRGQRIALNLTSGSPLFPTRCAGPLDVDLGAALPATTLSLGRVVRGRLRIDVRGVRRFSADGFSGVVRSTVVLRLGRARTMHPLRRSPALKSGRRMRLVTVTYRVQRLRGNAVSEVSASPDAAQCGPLDACGLSGTIGFVPGAAHGGSAFLTASASARRALRDSLAALGLGAGGNRDGIAVNGGGDAPVHGAVVADLAQDGVCRDITRVSHTELALDVHGGRLRISLSPAESQAADPLRTRCPGPELGQHVLTSGTLPRSALRRRTLTVALHGNSFTDGPYRVTARSALVLTLRRLRVRTQIFRLPSAS
jgi:hypothetical protein